MFAAPPIPSSMQFEDRKLAHWRPISNDTEDAAPKKIKASLAAFGLPPPRPAHKRNRDLIHKMKTRSVAAGAALNVGLNLDFSALQLGDGDVSAPYFRVPARRKDALLRTDWYHRRRHPLRRGLSPALGSPDLQILHRHHGRCYSQVSFRGTRTTPARSSTKRHTDREGHG